MNAATAPAALTLDFWPTGLGGEVRLPRDPKAPAIKGRKVGEFRTARTATGHTVYRVKGLDGDLVFASQVIDHFAASL